MLGLEPALDSLSTSLSLSLQKQRNKTKQKNKQQQTKIICSCTLGEARSPKPRYRQGWFLLEALTENLFHAFTRGELCHSTAYGCITIIPTPNYTTFFFVSRCPLLLRTLAIGPRAHSKSRMIPSQIPYITSAENFLLNKVTFACSKG